MSVLKLNGGGYREHRAVTNWSEAFIKQLLDEHRREFDHDDGCIKPEHLSQEVTEIINSMSPETRAELARLAEEIDSVTKDYGLKIARLVNDTESAREEVSNKLDKSAVVDSLSSDSTDLAASAKTAKYLWDTIADIGASYINPEMVVDNLESERSDYVLSAKQGRELKKKIGELIKFKHSQYGELDRTLQEQIGNLNYMSVKSDSNNNLVAGINVLKDLINQLDFNLNSLYGKHETDIGELSEMATSNWDNVASLIASVDTISGELSQIPATIPQIHFGKLCTEETTITEIPDNSMWILTNASGIGIQATNGEENLDITTKMAIVFTGQVGDDCDGTKFRRTQIIYVSSLSLQTFSAITKSDYSADAGSDRFNISITCPASTYLGSIAK